MVLVKNKLETQKFEDFMRNLYGNKAFIFFTMDKVMQ